MSTTLPVAECTATTTPASCTLDADPAVTLIGQAEYLFEQGFSIAAGMMARAALEQCLQMLCNLHGCEPCPKTMRFSVKEGYLNALTDAKILDRATAKHADTLFVLGNQVVHCEPITRDAVEGLLRDVRQFVEATEKGGQS